MLGEYVLCTQADMFEQYGRDALNNTSCECVVAKANEADCFANAEVQTLEERGNYNLEYTPCNLVEKTLIKPQYLVIK